MAKGDPTGAKRRGGSRTARGKRVPGVEIIAHTLFRKSTPFRTLLAKPHQSKISGISTSQLFGRRVANFFNPVFIDLFLDFTPFSNIDN
ncbi:hypothetical protein SB775_14515 [Peribacillus sp. SIMBA_075]|uniref:hypothetical protein n=1 Tax=Peribacillus sp. SIMBA_075 TaxID=3085813 RepID=UPI00397CFBC4